LVIIITVVTMRLTSAFLLCLALGTTAVTAIEEDATLPVVNVQYDFPAQDMAGAAMSSSSAGILAFKQRAARVLGNIHKDGQVLTEFASTANKELDDLMQILLAKSKSSVMGRSTSFLSIKSGQPLEAAGSILQNSKVAIVPDTKSIDDASSIIKGIAQVPAPTRAVEDHLVGPQPMAADSCERDYTSCPDEFVNIGPAFGGSTELCAATSSYVGPCMEAYSFGSMTVTAKARWSSLCQAYFPCRVAASDAASLRAGSSASALCPEGWKHIEGELKCSSPSTYSGPCRGTMDFTGYNLNMLKKWSGKCGAVWM